MARTTASDVQLIIETDDNISADLAPFIEVANNMVTKLCSLAVDSDGDLVHDATSLELVERWLSAHFYAIRDPRAESEKAGPVGAKYMSKVDLNLAQTPYGQQAMLLDYSGELATWNDRVTKGNAGVRVGVTWLGTDDDTTAGTV
jgi:hypothetical protein